MLPKRKIIRKRHRRTEEDNESVSHPTSLLEKLHSNQFAHIEEALVYISSMCVFNQTPELLGIVAELVKILEKGNNSLVYQCLYALGNLIELEPRLVTRLFQFGIAKALTQLNSGDAQLLKPILSMMIALHGVIPEEFAYLEKGVEQSLNVAHLESVSKEQVLVYLMRIETSSLGEAMYEKIYYLFKNQNKLQIRALCAAILMRNVSVRGKIHKDLLEFFEEMLCDIYLEKEYQTNIVHSKPVEKAKEVETQLMEQEEEVVPSHHPNFETFADAVQAVETVMETLLVLFEESLENGMEEEELEEQEGDWENEKGMEAEEEFSQYFKVFLKEKLGFISRNTELTFPEGQNIVHLALRLLASLNLSQKEALSQTVIKCIENMLVVKPPQQIQEEILVVGFHILMSCPIAQQARNILLFLGESVLKVGSDYKDCWTRLLEIYSKLFNPEKNMVSQEENRRVGAILRNLVINIPELALEEWRGQTIDTIFDVFSNESFDGYLVQLGLLGLLEKVLQHVGTGKKKKFVREVVSDIQRFLEYKRKMIKF